MNAVRQTRGCLRTIRGRFRFEVLRRWIGLLGLLMLLAGEVIPAQAAVFDYSAPFQQVTAQASASTVLLSVLDGQGQIHSTNVASGPSQDRVIVHGVVAWSSGTTIYYYTYDPVKGGWVGQADTVGLTYDLSTIQGIVTWSSGATVYYRAYDWLRGMWRGGSLASGTANGLQANDGVVVWSTANSVYFRVYDVIQGNWMAGSGPGPSADSLNRDCVVAWATSSSVNYYAYDPSRAAWRSGTVAGTAFDLRTVNGVVAWSSNPTVYLRVYDPLRGQWMNSSVNSGYTTDLAILGSTVTWSTASDFFARGYQPSSGAWTADGAESQAIFAVSTPIGNAPFTVAFIDMSLGGGSAAWSFGAGLGTSTRRSPFYRYNTFGRYTATLTVGGSVTNQVIVTDTLPPSGTNRINGGAALATNELVTVTLLAADNSGVVQDMRLANNTTNWAAWEPYATNRAWNLLGGNGARTVYAQFRDAAQNTSATAAASIQLDTTGPPVARFVNLTVNENAGEATVRVIHDHPSLLNASVRYATADGTATAGLDYTPRAGLLVFSPGATNASFPVPILVDNLVELNETIVLNFSDPTNLVVGPPGLLTIGDDELPSVFLSNTNFSASEGNGSALITVQLSAASGQTVTVGYGVSTNGSGGATPGVDYLPVQGVLTFEPGQTTRAFSVPLLDDHTDEPTESLTVFLTGVTNAIAVPPTSAQVTILDDDNPVVYFSADVFEAFENTLGTVSVWLSKPFGQEVRVNYSVAGGTASPGSDYIAVNGTLSFFPGMTNADILINLINDDISEDDETIQVRLLNAFGASLGDPSEAQVRVLDDDRAPRLVNAGIDALGRFHATAWGPPGKKFQVQYSANLNAWSPLVTLTNVTGRTSFTDPASGSSVAPRFYRTAP
ncbi:MAG TPA: Calx-beta domain-containing protein [Candidatus Dormibacteraeota bacterium]|nr:Calx-beta domain-containing protein [Candidatus Dormibacteraeota bacterium]